MNRIQQYLATILISCLAGIHSCNYEPELDIQVPDALIVVDGWIEMGDQAKVFLTTNSPYFTSIDSSSIRDLVLSRAKVSLSDGERSEVLILRKDTRYFPPYFYEGNSIFGDTGKVYTLIAEYGGKSISAETTIPSQVPIDTVFFEAMEGDSLGRIVIEFSDPADEKNYYRIFTKRQGIDQKFISTFLLAINDQYFNGESVSFSFIRAPESFLSTEESDYFLVSDTVIVKLVTMDKASFEFWNTYQDEVINSTNPFASSMVDLNSNVEGDGLGIWGGYGFCLDTVINSD